jgi:hypothetical protein
VVETSVKEYAPHMHSLKPVSPRLDDNRSINQVIQVLCFCPINTSLLKIKDILRLKIFYALHMLIIY